MGVWINNSRILNKEVRIYKEWVYKHYSEMTEDTDNGEFLGPSFDRMRESAISFVKNVEVKDVTETDLESILDCVARDEWMRIFGWLYFVI